MAFDAEFFKVEKFEHVSKFTNKSNLMCVLSFRPVFPKRKYSNFTIIAPGNEVILDHSIDFTKISISFEVMQ